MNILEKLYKKGPCPHGFECFPSHQGIDPNWGHWLRCRSDHDKSFPFYMKDSAIDQYKIETRREIEAMNEKRGVAR